MPGAKGTKGGRRATSADHQAGDQADKLLRELRRIAAALERLADHQAQPPELPAEVDVLDIDGAAELLGRSTRTLRRLLAAGQGPPGRQVRRRWRFLRSELQRWQADQARPQVLRSELQRWQADQARPQATRPTTLALPVVTTPATSSTPARPVATATAGRGRPLPDAVRARVVELLAAGYQRRAIAAELGINAETVARIDRARMEGAR